VVDRFSPQRVLMLTKYINTVLLAVLAAGVYFHALCAAGGVCAVSGAGHQQRVQHSFRHFHAAARTAARACWAPPTA
jgi:hypothetical protein